MFQWDPMKDHPKASEYLGISGKSPALGIVLDAVAWGFVAMAFSLSEPVGERGNIVMLGNRLVDIGP
jgi:hypothetical protein